ncbi:MAG: bifunctional proline dehydrogenase/L-glutamate gamma-semialdehyde dehydrogenase [Planctomycetota bacterium]|nr:bifunctional proline dehydrogenase/L-glutamate gamma-semialdehyde dehydrogenase [Planctomycetota bacterium]
MTDQVEYKSTDSDRPELSATENLVAILSGLQVDESTDVPPRIQRALLLARHLQERARLVQTPQERRQQIELDRLISNPGDRATLVKLTDQAFRTRLPERTVDQLIYILDAQGVPRFFSPLERTLLKGFQSFGSYLPGVAAPLIKEKMHQETANVVLPAEHDMLTSHLERRRQQSIRMNVNYLGESLLGEKEAERRLNLYLQALQLPEIECISVKISTLYSQISTLAWEHTISELCDRMELLYRAAARGTFTRADGSVVPKFVYLDMEEYRDMSLTAEVFMRTLERGDLISCNAGMVLQAYLPDSFPMQQRLTEWATRRVAQGGQPVTLRVVKGANLEMERVEASQRDWPQAPFTQKIQTDANFKRMIEFGLTEEHHQVVRLGIASHNLFDVAYALVLAEENKALSHIQFEMLEGMANPQRRALFELTNDLLLYAPACNQTDFIHAIGYLVRRLDENTGVENFLRYAFSVVPGSPDWETLATAFVTSFQQIPNLSATPRRTQNRTEEPRQPSALEVPTSPTSTFNEVLNAFVNEPDTDFSLSDNIRWAAEIADTWRAKQSSWSPLVIDGETILSERELRARCDPSRPGTVINNCAQATREDLDRAVSCAVADEEGWRSRTYAERRNILRAVAHTIRCARGELIGAALTEAGKTIAESDPEVSEAIDFVEFYPLTAECFANLPGVQARGQGVVVVIPPWNFPIAIPCGGIAAALAAGNTVILKPAPETALTAYLLCDCFWRSGVSRKTLQFAPCANPDAQYLATHSRIDSVIFTGSTSTARQLLAAAPDLALSAETGGKNATIVTALADRDQAIKHVIQSAFGHSGQKCSATSLLLLEEEVFDDPAFREALCDATASLRVGSAWQRDSRIAPLARLPGKTLQRGLKELEPDESWALFPRQDQANPQLISPGIKWNVRPGSITHTTEFFGPVLGVMKFKKLEEAIALVNATGYGLTAGLETLDRREIDHWSEHIRAGNLYVNRSTTGAIVLRQPFGGLGKSALGPGIKAGGPNYTAQFMSFEEQAPLRNTTQVQNRSLRQLRDDLLDSAQGPEQIDPQQRARLVAAIHSYDEAASTEFLASHDHAQRLGEDNLRRYLPIRELRIRITNNDTFFDLVARVAAATAVRCRITVSLPIGSTRSDVQWLDDRTNSWGGAIEFVEESEATIAMLIQQQQTERIRYAGPERVPLMIRQAAAANAFYIASTPVYHTGRIELLNYIQEQSFCHQYHRYGNLGNRASERRHQPR